MLASAKGIPTNKPAATTNMPSRSTCNPHYVATRRARAPYATPISRVRPADGIGDHPVESDTREKQSQSR